MTDLDSDALRDGFNALLRARRTVHEFTPEPVPETVLATALDALRWAPNHHRTEPWRIYLLGAQAQRRVAELNADMVRATTGERAAQVKLRRWLAMPGWLVLTSLRSADSYREREDYAACCCGAQNFMLSLWSAGVGVKWTTGAVITTSQFAQIVGFEDAAEQVVGLFWYGWPAQVGEQRRRPVADFVIHVE